MTLEYSNINYIVMVNYVSDYDSDDYVIEMTKEGEKGGADELARLASKQTKGQCWVL